MQVLANRLLAIISLLMALFCLYLALSLGAEKLLSHKLREKLQAAQIESDPALIQWSGKGLCAYKLRMRSPKHRLQAEIQSLCAELNLHPQWPFVGLSHISVTGAQVWFKLPVFDQSPKQVQQRNDQVQDQPWSRLEKRFIRGLSASQQAQNLWQQIQQALKQLNKYELSLHDTVLRLEKSDSRLGNKQQSPFVIGLHGQFNQLGGIVHFHSPVTRQTSSLSIASDQVELSSDLVLDLSTILNPMQGVFWPKLSHLTLGKGSKLLFKNDEIFINGQIKSKSDHSAPQQLSLPKLSFKLRSNSKLKKIDLTCHFSTDSKSSSNYLQVWGALHTNHLNVLNIKWRDLSLNTHQFRNLRFFTPFKTDHISFNGLFSGQLKLFPQHLQIATELSHTEFLLPSLPRLNWPKIKVEGELKLPRLGSNFQEWGVNNLLISVQGKQKQFVQAKVSFLSKFSPFGPNLRQRFKTLKLDLMVEKASCQALYNLIPSQLLGSIQNTQLSGYAAPQISFTAQRDKSTEVPEFKLKIKKLLRQCRFEQMNLRSPKRKAVYKDNRPLISHGVEWLNEHFTFVIDPKFSGGKKIKVGPESKSFVPYKELPSYIGGAMYLTEETGFWRGGAFSLTLLNRALNTNIREGRFVYGGSTITQQLVKNLFLGRQKTLTRKIREALISARIIDHVSKQRVLELYLNMIEFGPQIFGIQAAAQYYFQKDARNLSPEEAIFLAMLKVSPKRGKRWKKRGYSPKFTWWKNRTVEVFDRLVKEGLVTESRAKNAAPFILKWSNGKYIGYERLNKPKP